MKKYIFSFLLIKTLVLNAFTHETATYSISIEPLHFSKSIKKNQGFARYNPLNNKISFYFKIDTFGALKANQDHRHPNPIVLENTLNPGIYRVNYKEKKRKKNYSCELVISTRPENFTSKILVFIPDMTWQAYNEIGGWSFYRPYGEKPSNDISLHRPYGPHYSFHSPSYHPFDFLSKESYEFNVLSQITFSQFEKQYKEAFNKAKTKLIILYGHDEYWTETQRKLVDKLVSSGVSLLNLSGNTIWWNTNLKGHLINRNNKGLWRESSPEEKLLGSSYTYINYPVRRNWPKISKKQYASLIKLGLPTEIPFEKGLNATDGVLVHRTTHPIFKDTQIKPGEFLGTKSAIMWVEVDGIPVQNDGVSINKSKIKAQNIPSNFQSFASGWGVYGEELKHASVLHANTFGEGYVIGFSTIGWLKGVYEDSKIRKLTKNSIDYLLQKSSPIKKIETTHYFIKIKKSSYGEKYKVYDGLSYYNPIKDEISFFLDTNRYKTYKSDQDYRYKKPLVIKNDLSPGIYTIEYQNKKEKKVRYSALVISTKPSQIKSNLLVFVPDLTWQAYNTTGGWSFYKPKGKKPSENVSIYRPLGSLSIFHCPQYNPLKFLKENQYDFDIISQISFMDFSKEYSKKLERAQKLKLILLYGHDEYWHKSQRDLVDNLVSNGVNLLNLSGNTIWWNIKYSEKHMINRKTLGTWSNKNPEEKLLGGSYKYLSYPISRKWNIIDEEKHSHLLKTGFPTKIKKENILKTTDGILIHDISHEIFKETNIQEKEFFGAEDKILWIEIDGLPVQSDGIQIDRTKINKKNIPQNFQSFGSAWGIGNKGLNHASVLHFNTFGKGKVIGFSTIGWLKSLYKNSKTQKLTKNSLNFLLKEDSKLNPKKKI